MIHNGHGRPSSAGFSHLHCLPGTAPIHRKVPIHCVCVYIYRCFQDTWMYTIHIVCVHIHRCIQDTWMYTVYNIYIYAPGPVTPPSPPTPWDGSHILAPYEIFPLPPPVVWWGCGMVCWVCMVCMVGLVWHVWKVWYL